MRKRKVTDEEKMLFQQVVDEPRPLKAVTPKPKVKKIAAKPVTGLDGNTAEKLRRGTLAPQVRIDLHGLTEARAHAALLSFLRRAQKDDVRLALVITGVGNPSPRASSPSATPSWADGPARQYGILKQMVPRWLKESEFAALVSGSGPAHRRHGGDGALYVYLRKNQ